MLVDPTDEAADALFTPRFRRMERVAIRVGSLLARLRLLHPLYPKMLEAAPPDVRQDLRREAFTPQATTLRSGVSALRAGRQPRRGGPRPWHRRSDDAPAGAGGFELEAHMSADADR